MTDLLTGTHGVTESDGAYNKHAKLQAGGAALALPFLEKAVENVAVDSDESPLVIADYGSSQGKNSLIPLRIAVKKLRKRVGPKRPILAFHVDLPANDFSVLFKVVGDDPITYVLNEPNVFPCAVGRSFYESVLPPDSIHIAWSSYAAVWLSRIPARVPGHFTALRRKDSVRAAF